jgi:hypothetical protein
VEQSIFSGVGGRKTMLEKLWLAVTITFALNLFFQVHVPDQTNSGAIYQQNIDTSTTILVKIPEK